MDAVLAETIPTATFSSVANFNLELVLALVLHHQFARS